MGSSGYPDEANDGTPEPWEATFFEYAQDPDAMWPRGREHHSQKIKRQLSRFDNPDWVLDQIVSLANQRARLGARALFVINCGSSGSHWLTGMLGRISSLSNCREVYLPPNLQRDIEAWGALARTTLIDSVHLLHSPTLYLEDTSAYLINSAHSFNMADAFASTSGRALLVRDPVDIVLSRTFRKSAHRARVAPGESDQDYLQRNIAFVIRFFTRALQREFDTVVYYEDMLQNASAVVDQVCHGLGVRPNPGEVSHTVQLDAKGRDSGPRTSSNDAMSQDVVEQANRSLATLREKLGY